MDILKILAIFKFNKKLLNVLTKNYNSDNIISKEAKEYEKNY